MKKITKLILIALLATGVAFAGTSSSSSAKVVAKTTVVDTTKKDTTKAKTVKVKKSTKASVKATKKVATDTTKTK